MSRLRGRRGGLPLSGRARWAVGALLAVLTLAAASARPSVAAETPCPIPDNLALRDIALPAAKQAVAANDPLVVLTFGGVRPAGADADTQGATYPARLGARLTAALPQAKVSVVNEPPPGKTAADVPPLLPGLIAKTGARLVIWGPGTRDVAAQLDLGAFVTALNSGIATVRDAGADLILMDTTFLPAPGRMALIERYRQALLTAATANHVPLLRRHDMMRRWSEDGTLNMAAREPAEREAVARRLFSCVAQALAEPIAAAVRASP
jgi:hypothetical protein